MRLTRITLRNFKCFAATDLDLERGVTVIHGLNGSGKSSLLEACFFSLYGANALHTATLDEVITNGEDDAEVELWFSHAGHDYRIERHIRISGDRAQTVRCDLETPSGVVSGARDVRDHITTMLRMDAEAFINCAYVRQGEVNKLIHATQRERQDMIDELLQLGTLETYRERANQARLGIQTIRSGFEESVRQLDAQIEEKEGKDLPGTLNDLESTLDHLDGEIEHFESQSAEARSTLEEATEVLARYEERQSEVRSLAEEITSLREAISTTEHDHETITNRLASIHQQRTELESRLSERYATAGIDDRRLEEVEATLDELRDADDDRRDEIEAARVKLQGHATTAEALENEAIERTERANTVRERVETLETDITSDVEALEERRAELDTLGERLDDALRRFEDAPVDVGEATDHLESTRAALDELTVSETETRAALDSARESVRETEELLAAGKCPQCGQPVTDSPHVDSLGPLRARVTELETTLGELTTKRQEIEQRVAEAEDFLDAEQTIERLKDKQGTLAQLIEEKEASLRDHQTQIEAMREEIEGLETEAAEKRSAASRERENVDECRGRIATLNERRERIKSRIEQLSQIESDHADLDRLADESERLREQRDRYDDLNTERRQRLSEKRERKQDLEEKIDDETIVAARQKKQNAVEYLDQVQEKLSELDDERDDLIDKIGRIRNEFDELEDLRTRRNDLTMKLEVIENLYDETTTLEEMYGALRADLRQRNVQTLERMLNQTFELVYQNDSYSRIELDGDYGLTVYQKDGEPLEPEQLSGGERALFNLSLRCAIYRLLAEGIDGAAPMPPLILDEPTVFLDAGHVSRLVTLVESMRDLGVEQIVVVSHDEELIGAADDLVTVEKDPTSNRSTIQRARPLSSHMSAD